MKSLRYVLPLLAALACAAPALKAEDAAASAAAPAPALELVRIEICTSVADRAPQGAAVEFPSDVDRLWCFTRIASGPGAVEHVWYRDGLEMARVPLAVGAADWRTWSSKRVLPEWSGPWRVDVVDAGGAVLGSKSFRLTTPVAAAAAVPESR